MEARPRNRLERATEAPRRGSRSDHALRHATPGDGPRGCPGRNCGAGSCSGRYSRRPHAGKKCSVGDRGGVANVSRDMCTATGARAVRTRHGAGHGSGVTRRRAPLPGNRCFGSGWAAPPGARSLRLRRSRTASPAPPSSGCLSTHRN